MKNKSDKILKKYNFTTKNNKKNTIQEFVSLIDIEKTFYELSKSYSYAFMSNKYTKYQGFNNKPGKGPDPDESSTLEWADMDTDPAILLPEPDYGNFNKITKHKKWVLLEHQVTKERKWVDLNQIYSEGVPNAFYDADIHFCPEDVSKWS